MKNQKMILSASRVKQCDDCTHLFYQTYFKKVPENTHPKTLFGSLAHSILECLSKKKHYDHYTEVIHHQSVYGSPAIERLVKLWREKYPQITDEIISHLDDVVFVALNHDFFFKGASEVKDAELDFQIDFGKFTIKGFIDRMAIYKDENKAIIRDYKTQGKRFTEDELTGNIQAFFYQLAVKHLFGVSSEVEFLLVRHPKKFLQKVDPMTEYQIIGFKEYLAAMQEYIENLTEEGAHQNLKDDEGFCFRVCQLKNPFNYYVLKQDGKILKGAFKETELSAKEGQVIEKQRYTGCPRFFDTKTEKRKNWS